MAKRNFPDNPALKFISLPQEQDTAAGAAGVSVNEYAIQALNEKIKGDN